MESQLENNLKSLLNSKLDALEQYLNADVLVYYGPIGNLNENVFLKIVEELVQNDKHHDTLYIILTTTPRCQYSIFGEMGGFRRFVSLSFLESRRTAFCRNSKEFLGRTGKDVRDRPYLWCGSF